MSELRDHAPLGDPVIGLAEVWKDTDHPAPTDVTAALAQGVLRLAALRSERGLSSPIPDGYAEWKLLGIERRKNPAPEQSAEASKLDPAREGTPASAAGNAPGAGPCSTTPKGNADLVKRMLSLANHYGQMAADDREACRKAAAALQPSERNGG